MEYSKCVKCMTGLSREPGDTLRSGEMVTKVSLKL
jgi:hypothetical protein